MSGWKVAGIAGLVCVSLIFGLELASNFGANYRVLVPGRKVG